MARCRKTDGLDPNRPTNRMTGRMPIPHQARQTGRMPTCRQTDRLEAYPTFLERMVADGRSSIVKKRRCCVLEDKIRDTVPSVEEANWTPKTQSWNDRRDSSQDCQQDALNASRCHPLTMTNLDRVVSYWPLLTPQHPRGHPRSCRCLSP